MALAGDTAAEEYDSKTNEETLQLCFPLPPFHCITKYRESNVDNDSTPAPPKVVTGTYAVFGDVFDTNEDIIRPLEVQGIPQLFSTDGCNDILSEMKKINHSILANFLELLDTLVDSNLQHERELKLEDINLLFINLHHLINEFRPHQARETLRVMLQSQKLQKHDTAEKLNRYIERGKAILRNCQSSLSSRSSLAVKAKDQQSDFERSQKEIFKVQEKENVVEEVDKGNMCIIVDKIT